VFVLMREVLLLKPETVPRVKSVVLACVYSPAHVLSLSQYPFTTVIPNLGVWIPNDTGYDTSDNPTKGAGSDGLVLCDVPGLIKGAAQGVGLGHAFLRHVERCHVILHLIDATSNDPVADFAMLNNELNKYGTGQLGRMPQVVVVNKVDAFDGSATEDWEEGLQVKLQRAELEEKLNAVMPHTRLMWMSAKERDGVDDLMSRMATFVKKVKKAEPQ
jgi:GTP-binding protein